MNDNPLITEIRKKRAEILDSYQGDYHTMMKAMMLRQWHSGHQVVHLARKISPTVSLKRKATPATT